MRLQHRKDVTHDAIAKWLTTHGGLVFDVHNVSGYVDIVVVIYGRTVHVECKTGKCKPKPHQEALHAAIRNAGGEVAVVASEADCEAYFNRPFSGWYDQKTAAGM
jgi:hypothetical protein